MSEFLFKRRDNANDDPVIDRACYKRGDLVAIQPNGWPWGKEEHPSTSSNPNFFLVKVPDVNLSENRITQLLRLDEALDGTLLSRALYRAEIDAIPAAIRNQLVTTGIVTVTWAQIRAYIRNKRTGENA